MDETLIPPRYARHQFGCGVRGTFILTRKERDDFTVYELLPRSTPRLLDAEHRLAFLHQV